MKTATILLALAFSIMACSASTSEGWHLQESFSVIPGATRHDYRKENIRVFDFSLTDDEMAQMLSLNKEKRFFNMDYKQAEQFMLNWKIEN